MTDQNVGVPKPRKLWIDSTPFTPPSYQSDQSCSEGEHVTPAKVRLTHFTKKPVIDFGHAKIGKTITRKLAVENPNPYEVEVEIEKFPWKKEFQISEKKFWVQEESFHQVLITWTPGESGNFREMVMIKYDGSFRVHALIIGHVDTPKKKRSVRPLRRNVRQRTPLARRSRTFTSKCNEENIDPSSSIKAQDNGKERSKDEAADETDSSLASWCPKGQDSFSNLRASLFPLHVINGNHRDSSGSITAPTSPSGLEVPVIEDQHPSPLAVPPTVDVFSLADNTIKDESISSVANPRDTFCIDITSGSSNTMLHFTGQSLTGRPTFIMPPDPKTLPKQEPACEKSAAASKEPSEKPAKPAPLTPRSHRRSKTFTKREKCEDEKVPVKDNTVLKADGRNHSLPAPQNGNGGKMSMLDYALSVIAEPIVKGAIAAAEKSPDESSLEDSLELLSQPQNSDVAKIEPPQIPQAAPPCPAEHEASQEQLSSTYMIEPVLNEEVNTLPAPDVSAITCPSPAKKVFKRKSPISSSASRAKRAAVEKNRASPATPSPARSRRNSAKNSNPGARGTPKGRALQRRRVAKAGEEVHRSLRVPPNNKTKLQTSPVSGVKRPVQEKAKILKKRKVKVPPARLILRPSRQSQSRTLARSTLPFSSRNMLYDDKWWMKQENAYTCWLNYILTPDEFKPSLAANDGNGGKSVKGKSLHHSAVFGQNTEKSSLNAPAISKETASLRAYQMQRRLNRLRRAACELFESDAVIPVIRKIEEEVDLGRIKVRNDKRLWADLGNRSHVLSLLMSFNPLWLRVGLEATFGEALPMVHGNVTAISNFISKRLLNCEDIRREFAHPTVPNLFAPGYEEKMAKHTLKKFLILIFLLDQAKQKHLIDHDPCLFLKESKFKNCKDILISFSRDLLRGEGDIVKHLSFFGYKVGHNQTYIDEFEYGINNIAVDLRDGIRLVRVVELLFQKHGLVSKLRVPAGSILQKKHNVGVALKALEEHSVDICNTSGKKVDSDHVVKGHKEMTLALLWNIAAHFQLVKGIDLELLRGEIAFLKKNLRLKHMLENMADECDSEDLSTKNGADSCTDEISSLLLEWCRLVCSFKSIPVRNFGSSFTDGRVLACLVSYYQSDLIHPSQICMVTTMSQWDDPPTLDDSTLSDFMQASSSDGQLPSSELLKNERTNLKLVQQASYELGGIPNLLRIDDISNTIPDDKVVRLLVSFLCVRLLDIRIEDRAARTIQVTWLAYRCRRKQEEEKRVAEMEKEKREAAVSKIQAAYRGMRQRRKFKLLKRAVSITQKLWGTKKATQSHRQRFLMLRNAATKIQAIFRGFKARKLVATLKIERAQQDAAATKIQAHWRGRKQQTMYKKQLNSVVKIQNWFRVTILAKRQRQEYVEYRNAVVVVQRRWRATIEARKQVAIYSTKKEASILIQRAFRSYRMLKAFKAEIAMRAKAARVLQNMWRAFFAMKKQRNHFLQLRSAAVTLQCALRRRMAVKIVAEKRRQLQTALVVQRWWRATSKMQQERSRFLLMRNSCVTIQCAVRRFLAMKYASRRLDAILVIQRKIQATLLMRRRRSEYLQMRSSAVTIQCAVRCMIAMRVLGRIRKEHAAALLLQQMWRARKLMLLQKYDFCQKRSAAIVLQKSFRCFFAKIVLEKKRKERNAACLIQQKWRAVLEMRKSRLWYVEMRSSAITIQCAVRRHQAKKLLRIMRRQKQTATRIQRWWRATILMRKQRSEYEKTISSILLIQRAFLAKKLLQEKRREKSAATTLQTWWRATISMKKARQQYRTFHSSVIIVQSAIRRYLAVRSVDEKRKRLNAAITIQRKWQATVAMRTEQAKFIRICRSAVTIQCAYRRHLAVTEVTRRRRELNACLVIQKRWRATLKARLVREEFVQQRTSALIIQHAFRCYLARKEKIARERKSSAVTKIAAWWRVTKLMHQDKEIFLRKRAATVTIQCAFRSFLARRLAARMRKELHAACVIQRRWRALVQMRLQLQAYQSILSATLTIQCAYRRYRAILHVTLKRRQRNAAVFIQRKWRATILMRKLRALFLQQRCSAVVIQCAVRRRIASQLVSRKRKVLKSVLVIQRRWRATLEMRRQQFLYLKSYFSVILVQSVVRSFLARKKANIMRAKLNAALVLQQHWKATVLMRYERTHFLQLRASAIVIQCAVRRYFARKAFIMMRKKHEAAKCIQRKWKATLVMRIERQRFVLLRNSAIVIQCSFWRMIARRLVVRMRAELHAALFIQRKWRATLLMRVERAVYLKAVSDIMLVQCLVRRYLAQKLSAEKRKRRDAATYIQRKWRATVSMRKDRENFLQVHASAVRIQCYLRCVLARRELSEKRARLRAAVTIQQKWRATLKMNAERSRYLKTVSNIVLMQCCIRRYLAKNRLSVLRRRHQAATTIQAYWRAYVEMHQARNAYLRIQSSVTIIQHAYRSFSSRKAAREQLMRAKAATIIQKWWKATKEMQIHRDIYKKKQASVLVLQCAFRMYQASKMLHELQVRNRAASTIQQKWRDTLSMRNEREAFLVSRSCIITAQCCIRRFLAVRTVTKKRRSLQAALLIQARWRAHIKGRKQRSAFLQMRKAAISIQHAWRAYVVSKHTSQQRKEIRSAVLIQRWWWATMQMLRERKNFRRMRHAAITIQRAVRRYMADKIEAIQLEKRRLRSVLFIQRVYRGYCARKAMSCAVAKIRKRCELANLKARQNPELKIGCRMTYALDILLSVQVYTHIYGCLNTLYDLSKLLPECCERISEAGGPEVLCRLIDSTNRSSCGNMIHEQSLKILLNLIQNPSTRVPTIETLRDVERRQSTPPTELLVTILQRFREKGQRDRSHIPIFCAACSLLVEFCLDPENVQFIRSNPRLVDTMRYVKKETESRYLSMMERNKMHNLKKKRESVGYISLSSTFCEDPVSPRRSHALDVSTRETSFVQGHNRDSKFRSTPKSKAENVDPSAPPKPRAAELGAKKVVRSLYGAAPVPPKVKQSLVPQLSNLNTGIRIHRSKKVTKPQSPKLHGLKIKTTKLGPLKERKIAENTAASSSKLVTNNASTTVQRPVRAKAEALDPLSCIRELYEMFE